jgi:4-carboxymuconolactone decarboxylase
MRDKRLMTLAVVTALGLQDLAEVQVNAALENDELTEVELKEMAIFLTQYVGFPLASGFNGVVSRVAGKRKKKGDVVDKKANVNAAVKMSTGRTLDE